MGDGDGLVGRPHAISEFVVADHGFDPVRADAGGKRIGVKVGVEQDDIGAEQRRPEYGLDETSPVAAQDPDRL